VPTWSYDGQIPGPEIRVRKGNFIRALLVNQLPAETTVHWHGVAIRNNMDGVPGMTQAPVPAGREFTYQFAVDPYRRLSRRARTHRRAAHRDGGAP
jgi:FtsP/CotA-like multicopper oxidase with cupredoxin domain